MNLQYAPYSRHSRFVNLRHSQKSLIAVGPLVTVDVPPGSRPLLSVGDKDIIVSGNNLLVVNYKSGSVAVFDESEASPRCAVSLSPGHFTIFFDDGRRSYSIDGDGTVLRDPDLVVPSFSVTASPLSTVSAQIESVKLSRSYLVTENRPDPGDIKSISSAFLDALAHAVTTASTCSRFTSPTLVRTRVVDESGHTVFVGAPLLVNPLGKAGSTPVAVTAVGDSFDRLGASTVDIDSFGLELKIGAHVPSPGLSVIVEVLNLTSAVDFDGTASCVIRRDSSGNGSVTVTAPPVTGSSSLSRAVAAMLVADDSLYVTYARIDNPFDGEERSITLIPDKPLVSSLTPVEISRRFKKQLELSSQTVTPLVDTLAMPHTFIPTVAAKNGSAVLYANPDILFFKGYAPPCFVAAGSGRRGSWIATSVVSFADGGSVVSTVSGRDEIPLKLAPVLSYPSRYAVKMTVDITVGDSECYRHSFDLTPLSGRDLSVFIADDLQPVDMSLYQAAPVDIPVSSPPCTSLPGVIVTAAADDPFRPVDAAAETSEPIVAAVPVVCAPRGLEQRRNRFYIFGNEGIRLVTLNDMRAIVNVVLTDRRGVDSARCVAIDGEGRVIALTTGGHLLSLSGASSMTLDRCSGRAIAADNIHDEMWIISNSPDVVIVRDMTKGDYYHRLVDGRVNEVMSGPARSAVVLDGKIARVGEEMTGGRVSISATMKIEGSRSTRTEMGSRMRTPAMFVFSLGATESEGGVVTASADDTAGYRQPGTSRGRTFGGRVSRQVTLPVNFYQSETYTAMLEATVNVGAIFDGVKILYRR